MNQKVLIVLGLFVLFSGRAYGECKADAGERYQADVEFCKFWHGSPDNSADLRSCIQEAYNDFNEAYVDCDNTAPFYEIWQQKLSNWWSKTAE